MRVVAWGVLLGLLGGCAQKQETPAEQPMRYPAPRFPSYLKAPHSVEDVMPYARSLARQKSGFEGAGLGVMETGQTVLIVNTVYAEPLMLEAIERALEERGVKVQIVPDYEMAGVSRNDALAFHSELYTKSVRAFSAEKGFMEAADWIDAGFPDSDAVKKWLKARRPDLYDQLFPKGTELSAHLKEVVKKFQRDNLGAAIRQYLEKHPEVDGVFWGTNSGTALRRSLHPWEAKFKGLFTADNRWELMSAIPSYPADVWLLTEERTIEPLSFVDQVQVADPEGTDLAFRLTEEQAQRWAKGAYQRGHLYMFPTTANGRFPYSVVNYPAYQKDYLPLEPLTLVDGVIAGTTSDLGVFPRWEVHLKAGYIREVKGGGVYGDVLREFLQYPRINELTLPSLQHPGFWYLLEIALGSHPKFFRNPLYADKGSLAPERMRSGVIHFGLGITLLHDPDTPGASPRSAKFTAEHNFPRDHDFHTHIYFPTYRAHLRNTPRWINLIDRGHMTSLDNPEVRALASRYGDPNVVLSEDWIPEVPGINAPGRYAAYAADPWKTVHQVLDKAVAGSYEHLYPPGRP